MLKRASTIFLITLSLDLFDIALDKIAGFIASTSFQQTRFIVGYLYNVFVKVNSRKSLKRLLPFFITSIRREIDIYGASTTADIEILLGDCILVWNIVVVL